MFLLSHQVTLFCCHIFDTDSQIYLPVSGPALSSKQYVFTYFFKSFISLFNFLSLTWNWTLSKLNGSLILLHFFPLTQNDFLLSLSHFKWMLKLNFFLSFPPHSCFFLVLVLTSTAQKLTSGWVLSSKTSPLTSLKPKWVQNWCSVMRWVMAEKGQSC